RRTCACAPAFASCRLPAFLGWQPALRGFGISPAPRGAAGRHPGGGGSGPGRLRRPGELCPRGRALSCLAAGPFPGAPGPGLWLLGDGGLAGAAPAVLLSYRRPDHPLGSLGDFGRLFFFCPAPLLVPAGSGGSLRRPVLRAAAGGHRVLSAMRPPGDRGAAVWPAPHLGRI